MSTRKVTQTEWLVLAAQRSQVKPESPGTEHVEGARLLLEASLIFRTSTNRSKSLRSWR